MHADAMMQELLDLLACPECAAASLELTDGDQIICSDCAARYPIVNGVPNMLPNRLSGALPHKREYVKRLMLATEDGDGAIEAADVDTVRFMWEHHLYDWGKRVIYSHAGAGQIFQSYAEDGARNLRRFIRQWCGDVSGRRLLYVGSGNDTLVTLPLQADGALMVNLDVVSDSMEDLLACGARLCVCGDARRLPFRDGAFDIVFCKGSLHHSQPIDTPLKEMARVTRRGGHVIAAEPNRHYCLPRPRLPGGLGQPTPYESSISGGEVKRILSRQGIRDLRVAAFTCAHPATPAFIARPWRLISRIAPRLLNRFAFEFILHGRKA